MKATGKTLQSLHDRANAFVQEIDEALDELTTLRIYISGERHQVGTSSSGEVDLLRVEVQALQHFTNRLQRELENRYSESARDMETKAPGSSNTVIQVSRPGMKMDGEYLPEEIAQEVVLDPITKRPRARRKPGPKKGTVYARKTTPRKKIVTKRKVKR